MSPPSRSFVFGVERRLTRKISTFKYFCTARAQKNEQKSVKYALIAEVIRQGGIKMAIMVRYSSIPGHCTSSLSSSHPLALTPLAQ